MMYLIDETTKSVDAIYGLCSTWGGVYTYDVHFSGLETAPEGEVFPVICSVYEHEHGVKHARHLSPEVIYEPLLEVAEQSWATLCGLARDRQGRWRRGLWRRRGYWR